MDALGLAAVVAGVLGLAVGSFLNVVIYRVPRGESVVSPPSHCPRCETVIKNRHNVPVLGWIALRGRCASCRLPISARYPLVEAATGALFVVITQRAGLTLALPAYLFLAAVGVALAAIDFDGLRLPAALTVPAYVLAVGLLGAAIATGEVALTITGVLAGLGAFALGYLVLAPLRAGRFAVPPVVLALTAAAFGVLVTVGGSS